MTDSSLPLVSIVIANYNYGRFLGESIQSALEQTYPAVEIILVDDGSSDDSLALASRYPIKVFPLKNGGVSVARNYGASQSTGEYLLFLDSDDKYAPQTVARLLATLQSAPPEVAYVYCQMQHFGDEDVLYPSQVFSPEALIKGTFVNICSLIRRTAFEAVGGWDPTWRMGLEDYEFWVRMLYHGFHGQLLPEPLHLYRRHGHSRNALDKKQLKHLRWRLRFTYPGFYWRKMLKHPFVAIAQYFELGKDRLRHGPGRLA